jgi:hypothetical protein
LNELGGSKVQQLDRAFFIDQYIRRLQIEVNDQVAVGIRDRIADLQKQLDPLANVESLGVGILIEMNAIDVLHHEIRLAAIAEASVEHAGNVFMV